MGLILMNLSLFDYSYPKELIAQQALPERDASRMMVVDRARGSWEHRGVCNLPDYLHEGDLLVFNDTRVFPARLLGRDEEGRGVEILLLGQKKCLGKPLKRIKEGMKIYFADDFSGTITKKADGFLEIELHASNPQAQIEKNGLPPLPPYIRRKIEPEDKERYQSIFAEKRGSAAAPTASLHFSTALLQKIKERGVETAFITLHVSTDTFLPIRSDDITRHKMHGEFFSVPMEARKKIETAKRVIAVGTTVVRALESDWSKPSTDLFITPGFEFKIVDGLLTNFHQPESTLLVLVSTFAGRELILSAYNQAIAKQYRLFSYGDCMLIF